MSSNKLSPTTKDISSLAQMHEEGRLILDPDYQRESVWPPKARIYLIDTILKNKPIPMLFLHKYIDSSTNKMIYKVIDGQQRLRTVFSFLENKFFANIQENTEIKLSKFKNLPENLKLQFLSYDFVVMELFGFSEEDLRDIFIRMNRYVVRLNKQELRNAQQTGPFSYHVSKLASEQIWSNLNLFSETQKTRQLDEEFIAELSILYIDGPQDKKGSIDTYYEANIDQLSDLKETYDIIIKIANEIFKNIPKINETIFKKRSDFYSLIGAIFEYYENNENNLPDSKCYEKLIEFSNEVKKISEKDPDKIYLSNSKTWNLAEKYIVFSSKQTDNLTPRQNRINIIYKIMNMSL